MEKRIFIQFEDYYIPMVCVYPDEGNRPFPALLMLHGMLSYKEGDGFMLAKIAEGLKADGIASARIDFCSMGENRSSRTKYGLEQLLKETKCAYEHFQADPAIDKNRIGLLGHSLGGRVAMLSAGLNPAVIVTLNGAAGLQKNAVKPFGDVEQCRKQGYIIVHTSDGRSELLFPKFFEDSDRYNSLAAIESYQRPVLICVGEKDPTVDPQIGYDFFNSYRNEKKTLLKIADANHTFNAKTGDYTKLYELIKKMIPWLDENLK